MLVAALEAHKSPIIGIFLEGFSFTSGGLEVGIVFAQRCFHDQNSVTESRVARVI